MKILGESKREHFIAEISKAEIEKIFDQYYGKLNFKLEVGTEISLSTGYNFRADIQKACKEMVDAMNAFEQAQLTLRNFAMMVTELPNDPKS